MRKRVTITIDEEVLRLAEARVARGDARSLSALVSAAVEKEVKRETLAELAADILAEVGPGTPEDEAWARESLGI